MCIYKSKFLTPLLSFWHQKQWDKNRVTPFKLFTSQVAVYIHVYDDHLKLNIRKTKEFVVDYNMNAATNSYRQKLHTDVQPISTEDLYHQRSFKVGIQQSWHQSSIPSIVKHINNVPFCSSVTLLNNGQQGAAPTWQFLISSRPLT